MEHVLRTNAKGNRRCDRCDEWEASLLSDECPGPITEEEAE